MAVHRRCRRENGSLINNDHESPGQLRPPRLREREAGCDTQQVTDPPVFVVGYGHSGTTLLAKLLGRHPAIRAIPGETKFFERLRDWERLALVRNVRTTGRARVVQTILDCLEAGFPDIRPVALTVGSTSVAARDLAASAPESIAELFSYTASAWASRGGAQRFLEKTPSHVFCIDAIALAAPGAYFVEIVRDPRDVLASKKTRLLTVEGGRYPDDQIAYKKLEKSYDPLWDALSWRAAVRAGTRSLCLRPDRHIRVRYEDLVRAPESVMVRIFEALLLLPFETNVPFAFSNPADQTIVRTGIDDASVGRWKAVLNPAEVVAIQRWAGQEMITLNYVLEEHLAGSRGPLFSLYLRSGDEFAGRLWQRYRMGGIRYLWRVIRGYLGRAKLSKQSLTRS